MKDEITEFRDVRLDELCVNNDYVPHGMLAVIFETSDLVRQNDIMHALKEANSTKYKCQAYVRYSKKYENQHVVIIQGLKKK